MDNDIYVINLIQEDVVLKTYAFVGDTTISRDEFQEKRDVHLSYLKQHLTVSETIWSKHSSENFSNVVMIQDYIFPDDSVHTIKLKLFHAMQVQEMGIDDFYLYCETQQTFNTKHLFQILTNNKREVLNNQIMSEFLLNYECVEQFTPEKESYTFDEFTNNPLVNSPCGFYTPLGYNHLHYFFTANPNKVYDFNVNKLLNKDIIYYPNQLLLEVGQIKSNTLYVCLSETMVTMHKQRGLDEMHTIKVFYPELYRRQITSLDAIQTTKMDRYDKSSTDHAQLAPHFSSLTAVHDIYKQNKGLVPFIRMGIKEFMFMYHPPISFDIPIHLIFKIIHSSNSIPMIKFNPGKKQENLYRLFTDQQIAQNGRKIPILTRAKILQLMRTNTTSNTVICYCIHSDYILTIEFNSQGDILIQYTAELNTQKQPILKPIQDIEDVIRKQLTPIIETINSVISQSGIQYTVLESVINNSYIEILNIIYEYQIEISSNMDLTPYINCLSSFLVVESPTVNKGIQLTFKRVPNYNEHTDKDKLILNLVSQKKTLREIKHLLSKNFKLTVKQSEEAINNCLQNAQTEISVFGKQKTKLKDSPGISISFDRQNLDLQTSIMVKNISNIEYLFIIHKYINALFYLTEYPTSHNDLLCPPELNAMPQPIEPIVEQTRVLTNTAGNINDLLYDDEEDDEDEDTDLLDTIEDDEDEDEDEEIYLFSYGSNNKEQLEERIGRSDIQFYKASIDNYERIFGGYSEQWNGAVASIIEKNGEQCKGTYCSISEIELDTLDNFESSYTRELITITLDTKEMQAYTYIKVDTEWVDHPSVDYLDACYKTTQPFWNETSIVVKDDQSTIMGTYDSIQKTYSVSMSTELKTSSPLLQADNVVIADSSEDQDKDKDDLDTPDEDEEEEEEEEQVEPPPEREGDEPPPEEEEEEVEPPPEREGDEPPPEREGDEPPPEEEEVEPPPEEEEVEPPPEEETSSPPLQTDNVVIVSDSEEETSSQPLQTDNVVIASDSEEEGTSSSPLKAANVVIDSDSEEEDSSSDEDDGEKDTPQRGGGVKHKVDWTGERLNHPTPFTEYAQELDSELYLKKKGTKFINYSKACPSNLKRQPVILKEKEYQDIIKSDPEYTLITEENFEKIKKMDPTKYSKLILKYGSDPDNMFYYMCPRYWCLSENRPLTQEQVDNNECGGKVIKMGEKNVPKDTFIYSFDGKYNIEPNSRLHTIHTYPAFLKKEVHSDGYCMPCCMKAVISDKYLERFKPCSKGGIPEEDDEKVNVKHQLRILAPDKFPLENMKYGFLTLSLESFLKIKSNEFQDKNNISVKVNHPSILRRGVDKGPNKQDSFMGCIALAYSLHTSTDLLKPNAFRTLLADSITLDQFVGYHNGNLVSLFYIPDARHKHTLSESDEKSKILKLAIPESTKKKLIISFNAYKSFIKKHTPLDYEYLWDYICDLLDCNLIILHKSNDDITDRMEIVCPSNAYSNKSYVSSKKSLVLYLEDDNYEPILEYTLYDSANAKKHKSKTLVNIFFNEKKTHPHMIKLLKDTRNMYHHHCKPVKSTEELVFTRNIGASDLRKSIEIHHYTVDYDIIGYHYKIVGFMVSKNGTRAIVPCYPSNIELDKPYRFIEDERNWVHYENTRDFLRTLYTKSKDSQHPILCNPVSKIIDGTDRIVGLYTMTGQFVQVIPVLKGDIMDDNLIPIQSQHNYNEEDMIFDSKTKGDVDRERFVSTIKLEQAFYVSFRNTLKWILGDHSYHEDKKEIQALIQSDVPYDEKIQNMISLLQGILSDYVVFTSMKDTKHLQQIEMCCNKINKGSCVKTGSFCVYSNSNQKCKLHIPKENLQHQKDNEEIYYIKLADELIRYIHYQQYILDINNNTILTEVEYRINDNEIIILESTLLSNYFKQMKPSNIPKNIVNRTYDTTQPLETIQYDLMHTEQDTLNENRSELEEKQLDIVDKRITTEKIQECKTLTRKLTKFFTLGSNNSFRLTNCSEDVYSHQFTDNCVFILFMEICKIKQIPFYMKAYNAKTKPRIYKGLQSYIIRFITTHVINAKGESLQASHNIEKQMQKIFKTQEKKTFNEQLKRNIHNFPILIDSPDYYWSNIDLWILATKEKLPIILISKSDFPELEHIDVNDKKILLLYHNAEVTNYIILRQQIKTLPNAFFSYGLIHKDKNYLFTKDTIPEDSTIETAIKQHIPLLEWFETFIPKT